MTENLTEKDAKILVMLAKSPTLQAMLAGAENVSDVLASVQRGIALERMQKKCIDGTSEKNMLDGEKRLQSAAAWVLDFIKPSGTSGDRRISIETEHGNFTVVLAASE